MPEPTSLPPGDDRCLAGLAAALEAARAEPPERVLAGFAEAVGAELLALVQLRDGLAQVRALGLRERRVAPQELELRLPAAWSSALVDGLGAAGSAAELGAGERAALRLGLTSAVLLAPVPAGPLAPVPAVDGAPPAALLLAGNLSDGPWSSGQVTALRGLAAGLGGWLAARCLQQVLDHLPQRVAWKDAGLRYRGVNRAFARASGLTAAQVLGRVDAELPLRAESGDHGAAALRRERAAVAGAALLHGVESVALPGGRELWFHAHRVPLDGGGVLVVREDISARVQLGNQLQAAQRVAAIGRLAAGVGADLRPLAAAIASDVAAAATDPAAIDRLAHAGRVVDDLARQLGIFARRQLAEPAELVPGQLLARMEPTLARLLGEHVALGLAAPALRCVARVDARLLEQLFALLARDARERLGGRGRVALEVSPETLPAARALALALPAGEYVRVRLQAEADAEGRVDDDGEPGLHLALAGAIAAQAGGALHPGRGPHGAVLRDVYLPRVFSAPRPHAPDPRPVVDVRGTEALLLVEDDVGLRQIVAAVLRHLGYLVLAADDLQAALGLLQAPDVRVALALLSTALPGPADALRRLREPAPDLRVLWLAPAGAPVPSGDPLVVPCGFEALALRVRQALDARPT